MGETLKRATWGLVFVTVVVGLTLFSWYGLLLLMLIVSTIGIYEWLTLQKCNGILVLNFAFVLNFMILGFSKPTYIILGLGSIEIALSELMGVVLFFSCAILVKFKVEAIGVISKVISGVCLITVPCMLMLKLQWVDVETYTFALPLSIFILIWISDTMAYVVGRAIGKHKLFEVLSPKKTVEGLLGGIVFTSIAGAILFAFWLHKSWTIGAFAGGLIALIGVFGDLFISSIKRKYGAKDTGAIIPGHGGILDRFDAFLFAVPLAYILLLFCNYI